MSLLGAMGIGFAVVLAFGMADHAWWLHRHGLPLATTREQLRRMDEAEEKR